MRICSFVVHACPPPGHGACSCVARRLAPVRCPCLKTCRPRLPTANRPCRSFPGLFQVTDPRIATILIRTIAFEAGEEPDEGKAAVAHVVLNRERSGRWGESIKKVVTRAWQFEPWMTKRKQMVSLSPNDPRYRVRLGSPTPFCRGKFRIQPRALRTSSIRPLSRNGEEAMCRTGHEGRGSRSANILSTRRTEGFPRWSEA